VAEITKKIRVVNPGRRRHKRMTLLQKLHFGTARVRAAAQRAMGRKRNSGSTSRARKQFFAKKGRRSTQDLAKLAYKTSESQRRRLKRRNVGSIVTVYPFGNPGRGRMKRYNRRRRRKNVVYAGRIKTGVYRYTGGKKTVAKVRRRRRPAATRRRRRNRGVVAYNRPRRRRYVQHRRRRNRGYVSRRHHRRRNIGGSMLTGTAGSVVGVLTGLALTKTISGFLPATFATGILGYIGIGAVAVIQGKVAGKILRQPQFGHWMMVGGLAYLLNKVLSDFMPTLGGYTGVSGMGMIGGNSFYTPQVNLPGNMGAFVVPSAVMGALPSPTASAPSVGVGYLRRRTARLM
jgi:hypothetical protein